MRLLQAPVWLTHEWERPLARSLSFSWALFWIWFGFAAGAAEYASFSEILLQTLPGLLFLCASVFARRQPAAGGTLLIVMGAVVSAAFWSSAATGDLPGVLAIEFLLALPPVLSGYLYLSSSTRP